MEILEPENLESGKPFKIELNDQEFNVLIVEWLKSIRKTLYQKV